MSAPGDYTGLRLLLHRFWLRLYVPCVMCWRPARRGGFLLCRRCFTPADPAEQPLKAEQTSRAPTDQQTDTQRQHGDRDGEVDGATPDSFDHDGSLNDSGRAGSQREAEDVEAWRERRRVFEGPDS